MATFDARAKTFDTDYRKARAKRIAAEIREHLPAMHKTAMEFGCGTGLIGLELLDAFDALAFVDVSQGMVDALRAKVAGVPGTIAMCADLLKEPMDARFDCIFSSMALHHVRQTAETLSVLQGMLNDGGRIIIVDLDTVSPQFHESEGGFDGYDGFDQGLFLDHMREAGFRNLKIETFFKGEKDTADTSVPYSLFIATGERS